MTEGAIAPSVSFSISGIFMSMSCPEDVVAKLVSEIGSDLETDNIVFPTCLALNFKIRQVLEDDNSSLRDLANLISTDPLIAAKILNMANLRHYNLSGKTVTSLDRAIGMIGTLNVRIVAHVITMQQFTKDTRSPRLKRTANELWLASTNIGCWAFALADHVKAISPDQAMYNAIMMVTGLYLIINYLDKYHDIAENPDCLNRIALELGPAVTRKALIMLKSENNIVLDHQDYDVTTLNDIDSLKKIIILSQIFNQYYHPFFEDFISMKRKHLQLSSKGKKELELAELKLIVSRKQQEMFRAIFQY